MPKPDGKYFIFENEDSINANFLETFSFESSDQYIKTETNEFSAVCPFSGLPDIAYVKIEYYPDGGKCIELKSLKYYFVSLVIQQKKKKKRKKTCMLYMKNNNSLKP